MEIFQTGVNKVFFVPLANTNDRKYIKFMPRNIKFITILITLEDIEKIKTEKQNDNKAV